MVVHDYDTRLILDNYYLMCYQASVINIYQWIINNYVALFAPACLKLGFATRRYSTLQLRLPRACVWTHDQVTMVVEDGSFSVDTVPEVASYVRTIDTKINDS